VTDEAEINADETQPKEDRSGIPVRLGCGSIILLTIFCSVFILAIVNLIVVGEIDAVGDDLEGFRLWLVREDGVSGLGLSSSREADMNEETGRKCIITSVRFLKWSGERESGGPEFCECYDIARGESVFIGTCQP
jgi:hypothetical protein